MATENTGMVSSLGNLISGRGFGPTDGMPSNPRIPNLGGNIGGGLGGGGGSASEGLGQINQGAGTVASAISRASDALGSGGGAGQMPIPEMTTYKKGGAVKKYTHPDGKLNLSAGGVSTASKNKSCSGW